MGKIKVGKWNVLYPQVPVLVGTDVNGKPNYITIALVGWIGYGMILVSVGHRQYSITGIRENRTFSVNQPTTAMIKKLDYCGLVSGRKVDKSALFENFYGDLKTAPMIKECPLNLECRVIQTLETPEATAFIGEVNEAYVDEKYMLETKEDGIDLTKIDPVLFSSLWPNDKAVHRGLYWRLGEYSGPAWEIGKELKSKE